MLKKSTTKNGGKIGLIYWLESENTMVLPPHFGNFDYINTAALVTVKKHHNITPHMRESRGAGFRIKMNKSNRVCYIITREILTLRIQEIAH